MNIDAEQQYSTQAASLIMAGIDPIDVRSSIKKAQELNLPGWDKAEIQRARLSHRIETGDLDSHPVITYRPAPPDIISAGSYVILGSELIAFMKQEKAKAESTRTINSLHAMVKALTKALVYLVQNKGEMPKGFRKTSPNKSIVYESGKLNYSAIKDLLTELEPDTPKGADRIISLSCKE